MGTDKSAEFISQFNLKTFSLVKKWQVYKYQSCLLICRLKPFYFCVLDNVYGVFYFAYYGSA